SRGIGGRLATRRIATLHGDVPVDHGAQFFTCRSPAFRDLLTPLINQEIVTTWLEAIATLTPEGIKLADEAHTYPRYCCPQGMTTLAKVLAAGLTIVREAKVSQLSLTAACGWQATTAVGQTLKARALILTPPAPQSFTLLGSLAAEIDALAAARQVQFAPCLSVIAGYKPGQRNFDKVPLGLRWQDDPIISWSAVDSSKRFCAPAPILMFHTTPQFARSYEATDPHRWMTQVLNHGTQQLRAHIPLELPTPEWSQIHYWRYAQPVNPLSAQWLGSSSPAPLILCGCWCSEGRVEGAFLSGHAAAQGLLESGWLD
ncbi:MAG TPA: FAD-dependent oxidoreductase, partial [Candidatus Caenarcaniphilales bacterium]